MPVKSHDEQILFLFLSYRTVLNFSIMLFGLKRVEAYADTIQKQK